MSEGSVRTHIERQARRAIIENALFRPESALVIAGTILLTFFLPHPFAFWPVWGWLALGLVAEVFIVVSSLTDAATNERVISELFRQQFNPRVIRNKGVRQKVEQALEYQRRIETSVQSVRQGPLRTHMQETARGIGDWVATIFRLAQRLDAYLTDDVIRHDMASVKPDIENLTARLRVEDDDAVRRQLEATIASKRAHLASLENLDNTMQRADYLLEQSLSALGTVYSQLQLIGAKDVDSPQAQQLRLDIAEQVNRLQDIVHAMDEVYSIPRSP
jgi:hypothetical protein